MVKKIKKVNVLLTGIGGSTPRAIAKCLKKYYKYGEYRIIGTDCNPFALGIYEKKYSDKSYLIPSVVSGEYWNVILDIIKKETIDVAVVQPEEEVEAWAKFLKNNTIPCKILLPDYELIVSLRNKELMNNLLEDTNYIPKSFFFVNKDVNLKNIVKKIGYPYWLRSSKGSSGVGSLKINNIEEGEAWLRINSKIEKFTVSEYLPGRNLTCECLFKNGKIIKAACAERLRYLMEKSAPSGITGNISLGRLINDDKVYKIATEVIYYICKKISVNANGLLTVDLKEDKNGIPKVTEINVRHVSLNTAFAMAGANIAEDMVQISLDNEEVFQERGLYKYKNNYFILRDIDSEPMIIKEEEVLKEYQL